MIATTTVPARAVLPGDVVVTGSRCLSIAETRIRGDLCLLVESSGVGSVVHSDAELRVACADLPPFMPNGKDRADA